jgi:F-type H+-transporting ATPase subunit gamma
MASLRDIRRRINSVKSTQKITRAMKMVAAAKLRRAQEAITQTRPYAEKTRQLVERLAARALRDSHPLLRRDGGGAVELVVVTGDRGLCGSFNSSVVAGAMRALEQTFAGRPVEMTVIGRKGLDLLRRRPCTIRDSHTNVMEGAVVRNAARIADGFAERFAAGETHAVYCIYNEFRSAISQRVVLEPFLPFNLPDAQETLDTTDYLYEPSMEAVFDSFLRQRLHVHMHRIFMDSAASEQGARMTAMDSATKNAGDVITRLTLQYNRARQDAITKELIEVVSGAEAL